MLREYGGLGGVVVVSERHEYVGGTRDSGIVSRTFEKVILKKKSCCERGKLMCIIKFSHARV